MSSHRDYSKSTLFLFRGLQSNILSQIITRNENFQICSYILLDLDLGGLFFLMVVYFNTVPYCSRTYIEEKMGAKYVENRTVEFSKSFEETSPTTPIFFILSPGVNPLKDVEALGKIMGFTADNGNFHNVSLGQGQEIVAEQAMEEGLVKGHWVVLQVAARSYYME